MVLITGLACAGVAHTSDKCRCCSSLFNIVFLVASFPILVSFTLCSKEVNTLSLAALRQAEIAVGAQTSADASEAESDSNLAKASADQEKATEAREAAVAATEESEAEAAQATEHEAQAAEAQVSATKSQAAAAEATSAATAHQAKAATESARAYAAGEDAAATEAEAEADEATTGVLTFVPGVDVIADTVGASVAVSLHVKEAAELAAAAALTRAYQADQAAAAEDAATAATQEANTAREEAKATAAAAEAARDTEISGAASQTAKREYAAAAEFQAQAAREQEAGAQEKEAEATEDAVAGAAFRKALELKMEAFCWQVAALILITPAAFIVGMRKVTKSSAQCLGDLLAIGIVLRDIFSAWYLCCGSRRRGKARDIDALLESTLGSLGEQEAKVEKRIARSIVLQHTFGFLCLFLFTAPVWLRCTVDVGKAPRGDLTALTIAAVVAAKKMLIATMEASGPITLLAFLKYLIDQQPPRHQGMEGPAHHALSHCQVWKHAVGKAFEAAVKTVTTGILLLIVALFFSQEFFAFSVAMKGFMDYTWQYKVTVHDQDWPVAWLGMACVSSLMFMWSLCDAWAHPACELPWRLLMHADEQDRGLEETNERSDAEQRQFDNRFFGADKEKAEGFVKVLWAEYADHQKGAARKYIEHQIREERGRMYAEQFVDLMENLGNRSERIRMINILEHKLGVQASVESQHHGCMECCVMSTACCSPCLSALGGLVAFFEAETEALILGFTLKQWLSNSAMMALIWPHVWARLPDVHKVVPWVILWEIADFVLALAVVGIAHPKVARRIMACFFMLVSLTIFIWAATDAKFILHAEEALHDFENTTRPLFENSSLSLNGTIPGFPKILI